MIGFSSQKVKIKISSMTLLTLMIMWSLTATTMVILGYGGWHLTKDYTPSIIFTKDIPINLERLPIKKSFLVELIKWSTGLISKNLLFLQDIHILTLSGVPASLTQIR